MFDHIFENRDKKVTNIIKLSDYLGRSLRENVEVFSIDDTERKVTFITESGNIIAIRFQTLFKTSLKRTLLRLILVLTKSFNYGKIELSSLLLKRSFMKNLKNSMAAIGS